jgi:hypothetical protein
VLLVENERDQTTTPALVRSAASRLEAAGARVEIRSFDDEAGHAAFFLRVPAALTRALLDATKELAR